MIIRSFKQGEIIFRQGDFADEMFDIVSGSVGVYVGFGTGAEDRLTVLEAGQFLGEMGMIEAIPRSATAVAMEDGTELRAIDEKEFSSYFRDQPERLLANMRQISARLRDLTGDCDAARVVLKGLKDTQDDPGTRSRSLLDRAKELVAFYNRMMAETAADPNLNRAIDYSWYTFHR